jgi:hypothetical protein
LEPLLRARAVGYGGGIVAGYNHQPFRYFARVGIKKRQYFRDKSISPDIVCYRLITLQD